MDDENSVKSGYFSDDGKEIDPLSVPLPALCLSCLNYNNATEEVSCLINRMDQMEEMRKGEMFLCFAYEPKDISIDKNKIFREMEEYWNKKNQDYLKNEKN